MNPQSDIDILLSFDTLAEIQDAQKRLLGSSIHSWPIDWVLKLDADFQERKEIGGVCFEAFHKGASLL